MEDNFFRVLHFSEKNVQCGDGYTPHIIRDFVFSLKSLCYIRNNFVDAETCISTCGPTILLSQAGTELSYGVIPAKIKD